MYLLSLYNQALAEFKSDPDKTKKLSGAENKDLGIRRLLQWW